MRYDYVWMGSYHFLYYYLNMDFLEREALV